MSIAKELQEVLASEAMEHIRKQANPMQGLYDQMHRLGYAEKQTYNIASMDTLTNMPLKNIYSVY